MSARRPVLVIGDAILDRDVAGRVERHLPDTGAPVISVQHQVERPGGAALAASNLARTGIPVTLATPMAHDADGIRLRQLLTGVTLLPLARTTRTRTITRVLGGGGTAVRYDTQGSSLNGDAPVPRIQLCETIRSAGAILVSDYGAGTTSHPAVRDAVHRAAEQRRPVVWDPHPRGHNPVPGITAVTPNWHEVTHALARAGTRPKRQRPRASLMISARELLDLWKVQAVVVTDGERGATTVQAASASVVTSGPASVVAGDTCGAGDRFAAILTAQLAEEEPLLDAVERAVTDVASWLESGGVAIESVPVERSSTGAPGTVVATGGCFDVLHAGHVASLEAARRLGDRLVVLLNSDASVRRLKGARRPVHDVADRRRVLEALACVDEVIVFDDDTPARALADLRPAIWAKGGDYTDAPLPEAEQPQQWGARTVLLPYLPDRSTTRILEDSSHTGSSTPGENRTGPSSTGKTNPATTALQRSSP